jgi:RNA recognition motif-containing protein
MGRKLFVGNLPFETTEGDLQTLFEQAGTVDTVRIMRDMATGRARGFAFVEMATDDEAQKAIDQLQDTQLGGRTLTINEARPKADSGFGGGGGGRGGRGGGRGGRGGFGGGGGRGRSEPRW